MKRRLGFVSNSSSSAFVLIVPVEVHEKVLKEMHPYVRAVTESRGGVQNVLGKKCYVAGGLTTMGGDLFEYTDVEYDGADMVDDGGGKYDKYKAWYEYEEAIPEGSCFSWSVDG